MRLALDLPDLGAKPAPKAPPPPDPALLAAVRAEGVAEGRRLGHAAGLAEGRATQAAAQEAAMQRTLEAIVQALDGAAAQGRQAAEEAATALAGLLFATLDMALPGSAARLGAEIVPHLVVPLLPAIADRPEARLLVAPELAEAIAERMPPRAPEVVPDPAIAAGDARVEWRDGALVISLAARRKVIAEVLAAAGIPDGAKEAAE